MFKEGLILYGKVPQVDVKRLKLEPYSLVHFSLKKIDKPDKMRLKGRSMDIERLNDMRGRYTRVKLQD